MFQEFDLAALPTPYYAVDLRLLKENLKVLAALQAQTGCKILLAQKAFSMFSLYPLLSEYLAGATASGYFEARLAHEHFSGENHVFSPAFTPEEFSLCAPICDHVVFNSKAQLERFLPVAREHRCSVGLRLNPECSTQDHAIYDPCAPGSRLGMTAEELASCDLAGVSGLHFHTLCEQGAEALETTLAAVEKKFAPYLDRMEWVNFGGGHHITREGYDLTLLRSLITDFAGRHHVRVYLEPGEAVVLNTGYLVASVLELKKNGGVTTAILDASAACHMPDVLEMPYRPEIIGAALPDEKEHTYRLAGATCLAGDVIGDYSFDHPLEPGEKLIFCDMAHYSMVKNNTFNGMPLPAIALIDEQGALKPVRTFGYDDFKTRLS